MSLMSEIIMMQYRNNHHETHLHYWFTVQGVSIYEDVVTKLDLFTTMTTTLLQDIMEVIGWYAVCSEMPCSKMVLLKTSM